MSMYLQQEFDFVDRTKKILKQYDELKSDEKFEVTLLINCLVGLLILPQQFWFKNLPEELVSKEVWGISQDQITFIRSKENKTIKNVTRHLRNSVAHYRFNVFGNTNNDIEKVIFQDYYFSKKTFEATLYINDIKFFVSKFSAVILKKMGENK